ncbi:MAG TPA: universal stress protein [Gaiellaceae bacterium]|nr:universal stress protein [Gaiellaceae bacterium]HET8651549.1 universal stress protein [Gaiellaceae bacterium]
MASEDNGRIVVGVDGSEHARRALDWAVREARLRGTSVVAVHAYAVPPVYLAPEPVLATPPALPDPELIERLEGSGRKLLEEEVGRVDAEGVTIEQRVAAGSAADALVQAAREGDLLVVGSRGLGGFRGLLLGSVGQQVAHHAPCPVVIVPARD